MIWLLKHLFVLYHFSNQLLQGQSWIELVQIQSNYLLAYEIQLLLGKVLRFLNRSQIYKEILNNLGSILDALGFLKELFQSGELMKRLPEPLGLGGVAASLKGCSVARRSDLA